MARNEDGLEFDMVPYEGGGDVVRYDIAREQEYCVGGWCGVLIGMFDQVRGMMDWLARTELAHLKSILPGKYSRSVLRQICKFAHNDGATDRTRVTQRMPQSCLQRTASDLMSQPAVGVTIPRYKPFPPFLDYNGISLSLLPEDVAKLIGVRTFPMMS